MKIFLITSVLFCFWSVKILIDESYEVIYEFKNGRQTFENLFCFSFSKQLGSLFNNLTELELDDLRVKLFNHYSSSSFESSAFSEEGKKRNAKFLANLKKQILNKITSKEYHLYRNYFCLNLNFESRYEKLKFFNNFKPDYFLFERETYYYFKLDYSTYFATNDIHQLIVNFKQHPYSNCKKNYSKFECLNKCFKNGFRLSKYLYKGNESGLIYLSYTSNSSIKQYEQDCFDSQDCYKDDCKLTNFVPNYQKQTSTYNLEPSVSNLEFYIELTGLLLLFFNFSFYQLFVVLIRSIKSKNQKLRIIFITLKLLILIVFLFLNFFLLKRFYDDYLFKTDNPTRKEISFKLLEPEKMKLAVCIDVNDGNSSPARNAKLFRTRGLSYYELEDQSNRKFNQTIKDIHLTFQNRVIKVDYRLLSDVYFLVKEEFNILRCFLVVVNPIVPRYQNLLLNTKLTIESFIVDNNSDYNPGYNFKYELYLLTKNEAFTSRSFLFQQYFSFVKRVVKRQNKKGNCVNYSESSCLDRNCLVESCLNRKLIGKNFSKLFEPRVINKRQFNKSQWKKKIYFKKDKLSEAHFNKSKRECERLYSRLDCERETFEISVNESYYYSDSHYNEIDLYYNVKESSEEVPSFYKLVLDMLNIQNILFGFNAAKTFLMFYVFLKIRFKFENKDIYLYLIYSVCFLGFFIHIYFIIEEIITGELIESQHYEVLKEIDLMDVIFCFNYNQSLIDSNYDLTGNYLEEITKDLRVDTVFDKIIYLSEYDNEWITLDSSSNFTNEEISIETFYLLNKKCFSLRSNLTYKKNQFHFSVHTDVLRVYFNNSLRRNYHFLTKRKNTLHFSKMLTLRFNTFYVIKQELFEIVYNDKFSLIKYPLLLFFGENYLNDVNKYIKNIKTNFQDAYNLTTLNLVLYNDSFNMIINDRLFEQFFYQKQNISDYRAHKNLNYEREFYATYFGSAREFSTLNHNSGFIFNLIFLKKVLLITNEDNYAKLILNVISVLSFWLNFNLINTIVYKFKLIYGN